MSKKAFTLIELLIVVAIIGILAAIAVPNFLNAQIRAKAARSQADIKTIKDTVQIYNLDTNKWLVDGNDCDGSDECCFPNGNYFFGKTPTEVGLIALQGNNHFNGQIYMALTSPVNYLGAIPIDPFGKGVFYSYEDWGCSNSPRGAFGLLAASGPDGDNGDWHPSQGAVAYDSSNGVGSSGDMWYVWKFRDSNNPDGERNFDLYYKDKPWAF